VRCSSTSNKGLLYFVALKFAGIPDHHIFTDSDITGEVGDGHIDGTSTNLLWIAVVLEEIIAASSLI
jgi:hypothetical protein